eukprot:GFUD01016044.1.p1 GENE.GFUD01016044.1~~GFUD01016044.1.p1  ORF type:complete len:541 (+),score=138.72 GFUD01016044.1:243-1865(+)
MEEETKEEEKCYIGLDFSTQQIKAVVINAGLEVTAETHVHFDSMLPEYRTYGGVHTSGKRVTAPTIMWVKALDMLLDKLRVAGVEFSKVAGISGAGQQHGSVYWRKGAEDILAGLQPERFMHEQLSSAFSVQDSPIWMDCSTSEQCALLEASVGGPEKLSEISGSRAYERFTGNQICKLRMQRGESYSNTERVSLVSSFAASLLVGRVAGIDWADAGGMNLLDIRTRQWNQDLLDAVGPDLASKLGVPISSSTVVGTMSTYMQDRYGFDPECVVGAFTGDNPSSLAGLAMKEGDIGLSLGTSDTVFVWLKDPQPQLTGHVWPNPVDETAYMALLCYKNGSLTRERLRDSCADGNWDIFNELIDSTTRGNFGNIGMYFDHPEIVPDGLQGDYRFNKSDDPAIRFASNETEVRALIEGQMMAKRVHAERIGFHLSSDTRILVTGGASVNTAILQVIADVFNANVYTQSAANSAAMGGAYRALHLAKGGDKTCSFSEMIAPVAEAARLVARPNKDAVSTYNPLIERFKHLEKVVIEMNKKKET